MHFKTYCVFYSFENILENGGFGPFSIMFTNVFKTFLFQYCIKIENDVMI